MRFQVIDGTRGHLHSSFTTERGATTAAKRLSAGNAGHWTVRDSAKQARVQTWECGALVGLPASPNRCERNV